VAVSPFVVTDVRLLERLIQPRPFQDRIPWRQPSKDFRTEAVWHYTTRVREQIHLPKFSYDKIDAIRGMDYHHRT